MTDGAVYQAGAGRADITPPVGIRLCGYAVREGLSRAVLEPLCVTALVLRGGATTIALVALDLTLTTVRYADSLRQACAEALGVPVSHVLINYNHTHSAPCLPEFMPYDTPEQQAMQSAFAQRVLEQSARACREAAAGLRPARLASGWGECRGNIHRRQRADDGTMLMGENPNGPNDTSVGVIRVDDLSGHPIAVAFRYSCHTVTLGPRTNVISPDFPGTSRQVIEAALGCLSLFLQGCGGNQNPATGIGQDVENIEDTLRLGHMLGGEALKVCQTLRTHRRRKEPVLIRSVSIYWMYEYEPVPPGPPGSIAAAEQRMELMLEAFAPMPEIQREHEGWHARLEQARRDNVREADLNVAVRFDYWSKLRLDAARGGNEALRVSFPVQTIRLGPLTLVGLPFEVMAETGMALRDALGPDTFVLGYSNGIVSYLPTPDVSREGGMEAKIGYKNYLLPSELPGDWEPRIRETVLQQAQRLR